MLNDDKYAEEQENKLYNRILNDCEEQIKAMTKHIGSIDDSLVSKEERDDGQV